MTEVYFVNLNLVIKTSYTFGLRGFVVFFLWVPYCDSGEVDDADEVSGEVSGDVVIVSRDLRSAARSLPENSSSSMSSRRKSSGSTL